MITIAVKTLREVMGALMPVVEARNTIPILSTVLLSSGPSTVTFTVSDMDIIMQRQADLAEPGKGQVMALCVDARALNDIARKLPADAIATLEPKDGKLLLKAGRSRFNLPTLAADDFPIMATGDWDAQFEIPSTDLVALIDSVRFAMSSEETRYYLNGIFLHAPGGGDDGQLMAVATDGSRLARFHCDLPDGAESMPDIIVARKTVGVLDKLLDDHAGPVDIAVSASKIRLTFGTIDLTAKLVDGTFPDYNRAIPTGNSTGWWVKPKELAEAVDRVTTISSDKTRVVKIALADNVATLSVHAPDVGEATEEVDCIFEGEPMTIGFNGAYLMDVLRHMEGADQAHDGHAGAMLAEASSPSLWRDSEDSRRLYVLMPFRV